jgi:cell division septation protein DedD
MAYVFGPIGPDERSERIFVRRRIVVAITTIAFLVSAGGLFAVYRSLISAAAPGEVPVIRADTEPTRKRPDNPGGIMIPGQGAQVLDPGRGDPKFERLLPPPEAPLPRPAPVEPPVATPPLPATSAPVDATTSPPAAVATAAALPPAAVATATPPPAKAVVAAPPAAAAGKGYRLQLGAVRTPGGAQQEWERLKRLNGDVLGALAFSAERVDLGSRGIFYRIQAGPLADAKVAEHGCSELQRRGIRCILVRP